MILAEVAHDGVDLARIETRGHQQVARMSLKRIRATLANTSPQ
jgi:hypothetical protein